ncbi:MAG: pyrroloquinoline-quinone synthase PqqC [Gammaproteobacteria bacterium]
MVQLVVRRPPKSDQPGWTRETFEAHLRAKERLYHIHHPFQVRMNAGELAPAAIRGWVANRFYYQTSIPIKDAAVMANCRDRDARRLWVQRIIDHDGVAGDDGGIEAWLQLGDAVGLPRAELLDERHVLPGVRFAVDAYVNFARNATFEEAACSSLTELFAPTIHQRRLDNWPTAYPWIEAQGYNYFRKRLSEARRDVEHGLKVTLEHFTLRHEQEYALNILQFKLDVLWTMLDAMWMAYMNAMPPYHSCPEAS